MQSGITIAFGLPITSTEPLFLAIVGIQVPSGLAVVVSGAEAMLSGKDS